MLEAGDSVMANKGFKIEDLCKKKGASLNIPPFIQNNEQLSYVELIETLCIEQEVL